MKVCIYVTESSHESMHLYSEIRIIYCEDTVLVVYK